MSRRFTNKLINESSLYLRQHAHNPVNWFPWGDEALQKAVEEDKPILISIGYAACHWCHVMERESFENEEVAAFMNRHFINIKIDREERPDLDHIYMDAVQAMIGSGGWPLNVFCTPDTKPFFGGTYFPPISIAGRISWLELLQRIQQAWENKRDGLEQQAGRILEHISSAGKIQARPGAVFSPGICSQVTSSVMEAADKDEGGFGSAPKFPQTLTIRYLLEYAGLFKDNQAREHAERSLKKMIRGGIYDHLGGGLARYSTDEKWLVPHFEKMLYDNALLISVLSMAYSFTGDREYADAIHNTIRFIQTELKDSSGGYYSSLDADSEGEEGKYYVWSKQEIDSLLGEKSDLYCRWYGITESGNWEGVNILNILTSPDSFAAREEITLSSLRLQIEEGNKKLLRERSKRVRPLTDDKILAGWNALLVSAYCRAYSATGHEAYRSEAAALADFIFRVFEKEGQLHHSCCHDAVRHPAFLDDMAYLIEACLLLQEITGEQHYLDKAHTYLRYTDDHFLQESGYYSYTDSRMKDILFRKTEYYDGAMPSGNSTMALNLFYLGRIFDDSLLSERAEKMVSGLLELTTKFPVSFSLWNSLLIYKTIKNIDLVLTGEEIWDVRKQILGIFLPGRVFQSSQKSSDLPLLRGKTFGGDTHIYLCINNLCLAPLHSSASLKEALEKLES